MTHAIITSDVHLGSPFCDVQAFVEFLDALPAGDTLVLNGDIVDTRRALPPLHVLALERLVAESRRREVVWIRGNNDCRLTLKDPGAIRFQDSGLNGGAVLVTHGHEFDGMLHHNPLLTFPFRAMYGLRELWGATPMHIGAYAKRWAWLYRAIMALIVGRAVRYAARKGCHTIVCGHTHCTDDRRVSAVRYVNTGSWTEAPYYCALMDGDAVTLKAVAELRRGEWKTT